MSNMESSAVQITWEKIVSHNCLYILEKSEKSLPHWNNDIYVLQADMAVFVEIKHSITGFNGAIKGP